MGVDNLLGFVKAATTQTYLKSVTSPDSTAAVDISHWIYKASYACPEALYHRDQIHVAYKVITKYIDNYVNLLKEHKIKLTFVFDGMKLPAKRVTHKDRAERKAENRRMVEKFLARNDKSEARKYMLRCIDIKFDIVEQIIDYCIREKIDYIVAPYEADAQLAYLNLNNICDFIITEDTDLILYGCNKIIYKLDNQNGHCLLYDKSKLSKCLGPRGDEVDFVKFRRMCILSGCDYLKNIQGVGLQSAKKFFLLTRQDNLKALLPKLPTYLKSDKLIGKVTPEYIEGFINAETTFMYHIVYDPINERLVPLTPYPKGLSASDFPLAGRKFHSSEAKDLVKGKIKLDNLNPDTDLDAASDCSELTEEDEEVENEEEQMQQEEDDDDDDDDEAVDEEDEKKMQVQIPIKVKN